MISVLASAEIRILTLHINHSQRQQGTLLGKHHVYEVEYQ